MDTHFNEQTRGRICTWTVDNGGVYSIRNMFEACCRKSPARYTGTCQLYISITAVDTAWGLLEV